MHRLVHQSRRKLKQRTGKKKQYSEISTTVPTFRRQHNSKALHSGLTAFIAVKLPFRSCALPSNIASQVLQFRLLQAGAPQGEGQERGAAVVRILAHTHAMGMLLRRLQVCSERGACKGKAVRLYRQETPNSVGEWEDNA